MVDENGILKGMKMNLQEGGVNTMHMKAKDMKELLKTYPDFTEQTTILEDYVWQQGHICFILSFTVS